MGKTGSIIVPQTGGIIKKYPAVQQVIHKGCSSMHRKVFIIMASATAVTPRSHIQQKYRFCLLCVSVETLCSNRQTVRVRPLARQITYFKLQSLGELARDCLSLIRSWHTTKSRPRLEKFNKP